MITFITIIHFATILLLVIAVLIQSGKGAEISATFGGSSQTVFGTSGGQNFIQKLTYILAAVFMCTSLALTILPAKTKKSVFEGFTPPVSETAPASAVPATTVPATGAPTKEAPKAAEAATGAAQKTAPAQKK
jgi:preprotein translocase subunit SecG